jgi:putative ABC transport system permease protein
MIHDLRYALRALRNRPMFTLVAVATLALGIGVTAAVFTLANGLVLRQLPGVTNQDRVAIVESGGPNAGVSYPDLDDLQARMRGFSSLAGLTGTIPVVLQVDAEPPHLVSGTLVSSDYFSVLGVRMAKGRPFTKGEEATGADALVAVISNRVWRTVFGSDSGVVGRSVTVNGLNALVTGVAPPGFRGIERLGDLDVWLPATAQWAVGHFPNDLPTPLHTRSQKIFDQLVGRLAPGVTIGQVEAQLQSVSATLAQQFPEENERWREAPLTIHAADGVPGAAREYVRRILTILMGVAALVLALACANVTNLLLSRGVTRRGEVAVRRALGGSRGRLIGTQLMECLLLSAAAGAVGLVLAVSLASLFRGMTLPGSTPWLPDAGIRHFSLDWRVIGFTELVALLAGIVAGILPSVISTRVNLAQSLKGAGTTGVIGRGRLRGSLVAVQLAISVALLVTALLLVRTVRNLGSVPIGFDAHRVVAFTVWPPYSGFSRQESHGVLERAVSHIRSIPGVESAALTAYTPFSLAIGDGVQRKGATSSDPVAPAVSAWVGPGYFQTMGISLLVGRGFAEDEAFVPATRSSDGLAVISASQARTLFATVNVVGQAVTSEAGFSYRVIGVARDTRWSSLLSESEPAPLYQPLFSFVEGGTILVRSRLPLSQLQPAVERAVATVAPSVPVFNGERLSDKIARSVAEQRLFAKTLSAFTLLAVTLAGIGLYAVIAFSVAERTREMGIRMALGARAGEVVAMVVGRAVKLGVASLVLGIAGAVGLSRVVASQLYGVSPLDVASYLVAVGILLVVVLVASAVPARRATEVDPVVALQAE